MIRRAALESRLFKKSNSMLPSTSEVTSRNSESRNPAIQNKKVFYTYEDLQGVLTNTQNAARADNEGSKYISARQYEAINDYKNVFIDSHNRNSVKVDTGCLINRKEVFL